MKFSLTEFFCELVSGIAVILGATGYLCSSGILRLRHTLRAALNHDNWPSLVFVLTAAFVAGLVADAIGMAFDRYFSSKVCPTIPSAAQKKAFWKNSAKHVIAYREQQWAYYSLYRNLFLVTLAGAGGWLWISFSHFGCIALIAALIGWAGLLVSFWICMQDLLGLYYALTTYIDEPMTAG